VGTFFTQTEFQKCNQGWPDYRLSVQNKETPPPGYNFQYSAGFSMQTTPTASPKAGTPSAGTTMSVFVFSFPLFSDYRLDIA
jgi:hypothetical protein